MPEQPKVPNVAVVGGPAAGPEASGRARFLLTGLPVRGTLTLPSSELLMLQLLASYGSPTGSLADPAGSSVILAAIAWLEGTLLGTVATTVAIIAVASVGLMMLTGRVNVRHGLTVVAGSFILFGASSIVAGIQSSVTGGDFSSAGYVPPPAPPPPPVQLPPANPDPYAGASVPRR